MRTDKGRVAMDSHGVQVGGNGDLGRCAFEAVSIEAGLAARAQLSQLLASITEQSCYGDRSGRSA